MFFICSFFCWTVYAGCVDWPQQTFTPQADSQGKTAPDVGIYWYNTQQDNTQASESVLPACRSDDASRKAECLKNLESKGYFDPKKPTIIFIHGWKPNKTKEKWRIDFCYQYLNRDNQLSPVYNTLRYWKGWNVGIFYWSPFADEPGIDGVFNAEGKIYGTQGQKGMRWDYLDKQGQLQYCTGGPHCHMPTIENHQPVDVLQLLEQAYRQALPNAANYKGSAMRIASQSLGSQLAIQLTNYLLHHKDLPQPTRLALMDPYMSPNFINAKKYNLPSSVAKYNEAQVKNIEAITDHHFPITVFRTSGVSNFPYGNPAKGIMKIAAFMKMMPECFYPNLSADRKTQFQHLSAFYLYFQSMKSTPNVAIEGQTANYVNASATVQQVLTLMGQKRYQLYNGAAIHFPDTNLQAFSRQAP